MSDTNNNALPITQDDIAAYIKENLRINASQRSEYSGDMDGSGSLYTTVTTIELLLDGEVISEVTI